jgi:hypothetical protein
MPKPIGERLQFPVPGKPPHFPTSFQGKPWLISGICRSDLSVKHNQAFHPAESLTLVEIESTDTAPFLIVGDTMSTRRDLYKDGVDFTTLALQSLDFAK